MFLHAGDTNQRRALSRTLNLPVRPLSFLTLETSSSVETHALNVWRLVRGVPIPIGHLYRSSGVSPVCLDIRANIFGLSSSRS
jgi:hypothetical protein